MAHKAQIEWCDSIKVKFPDRFKGAIRVLDVGSLDVSGCNNKRLFNIYPPGYYTGLDIVAGENVDVVSIAHLYKAPDGLFDVICSCNALEHDMYYPLTLDKMCRLLRPNGLMFMSIGAKWEEHGTLSKFPSMSGTSQLNGAWSTYYQNLEVRDIIASIDLDSIFSEFQIGICDKDLQFWGIKNANS